MSRPIKIQHPTPKPSTRGMAIIPVGLYCNKALQTAKIGDVVQFQCEWQKDKRVITNICRFRINSPEFTFMLRSIYGENMTIAKLMEKWEAWAIVEGIGKDGFSRDEALLLETRPYDAELAEMEDELAAIEARKEAVRKMLADARKGVFNHKDIL